MPQVTIFNLEEADLLPDIAEAVRHALTSMPELQINDHEIDLVPVLAPDSFDALTTRINVDLWKAVIRPYDVGRSGWVSLGADQRGRE